MFVHLHTFSVSTLALLRATAGVDRALVNNKTCSSSAEGMPRCQGPESQGFADSVDEFITYLPVVFIVALGYTLGSTITGSIFIVISSIFYYLK